MGLDLKNVDIELLVDKSGSMLEADCQGGMSRWAYAQESTMALANGAQAIDPDGITVVPFNNQFKVHESVTPAKVKELYAEHSPMGSTDTAGVLKNRLDAYFARKAGGSSKSVCLLVMTDGAPNDQDAVERVIIEATQQMDADEEIGIAFVQIGNDENARKFLVRLDDGLVAKGAKFDIVDTTEIDKVENLLSVVEGAFAD